MIYETPAKRVMSQGLDRRISSLKLYMLFFFLWVRACADSYNTYMKDITLSFSVAHTCMWCLSVTHTQLLVCHTVGLYMCGFIYEVVTWCLSVTHTCIACMSRPMYE